MLKSVRVTGTRIYQIELQTVICFVKERQKIGTHLKLHFNL